MVPTLTFSRRLLERGAVSRLFAIGIVLLSACSPADSSSPPSVGRATSVDEADLPGGSFVVYTKGGRYGSLCFSLTPLIVDSSGRVVRYYSLIAFAPEFGDHAVSSVGSVDAVTSGPVGCSVGPGLVRISPAGRWTDVSSEQSLVIDEGGLVF